MALGVAGFGPVTVPPNRLRAILLAALTLMEHMAKVVARLSIAFLGERAKGREGRLVIPPFVELNSTVERGTWLPAAQLVLKAITKGRHDSRSGRRTAAASFSEGMCWKCIERALA